MSKSSAINDNSVLISGGIVLSDAHGPAEPRDVLVEGNRIAAIGRPSEMPGGVHRMDATGKLIVPGFVNSHTHGRESLSKGLVDGFPLEVWLQQMAAFTETRSAEDQYVSMALGAIEMIKGGITSAYDLFTNIPVLTVDSILAAFNAYNDVGMRALLAPSVSDIAYHATIPGLQMALPREFWEALDGLFPTPPVEETVATVRESFKQWKAESGGDGRVLPAIAPVIIERCSERLLDECKALQADFMIPMHTHLAETRIQALQRLTNSGITTVEFLDERGMLDSHTTMGHCIWLESRDLQRLAERGSTVAHNPLSNMKLGSGRMPLIEMRKEGVNVAVGTDGFSTIFEAARSAAFAHRTAEVDFGLWPTHTDILELIWVGGSHAMDSIGEIGRLEPGYLADLVVLDLDADALTPFNNAPAQIVLCETGSSVDSVMVDGQWVVRNGECTNIDEQEIKQRAREIAEKTTVNANTVELVESVAPYVSNLRKALLGNGADNRF